MSISNPGGGGGVYLLTVPGVLAVGPRSVPLVIPQSGRLSRARPAA